MVVSEALGDGRTRGEHQRRDDIDLRFIEILSPNNFLLLLVAGSIEFPIIGRSDIQDRSSTDVLALVTAIQVLWLVIRCMARYTQRLAQPEVTCMSNLPFSTSLSVGKSNE